MIISFDTEGRDAFIDIARLISAQLEKGKKGEVTVCHLFYEDFNPSFNFPNEDDARAFYELVLKAKKEEK